MGCGSSSNRTQYTRPREFYAADFDYMCKILLVGDSGVGKSSLMLKFTEDVFKGSLMSTVGLDFKIKTIIVDGKRVKLQIWDSAGQERFRNITKAYYRGAHAVVLVYDITQQESYDNITYWLSEVEKNNSGNILKMMVGNKSDLENQRIITTKDAADFCQIRNIEFMETSAKDGVHVHDLFTHVIKEHLKRNEKELTLPPQIHLE
jgi:small GTP-binding protein